MQNTLFNAFSSQLESNSQADAWLEKEVAVLCRRVYKISDVSFLKASSQFQTASAQFKKTFQPTSEINEGVVALESKH
jgi:hypothetical protein